MTDYYDIAIIGAGPAGCACALALRDAGLRVVLADQAIFPRDKICGDAIPGDAFRVMDRIDPEWGRAMRGFADKLEIRASRGFAPNGRSITMEWKLYSYNSKRWDFDHFLVDLVRSGTETVVMENKRLEGIVRAGDEMQCRFGDGSSVRAAIVIGCDGANSMVGRRLAGVSPGKNPACVAVRAYCKGVEGATRGVNEFHFFQELTPGYFWIFPLADDWVNVGFGLLNDIDGPLTSRRHLRQTLDLILSTYPRIAPRFRNAERITAAKGFALPLGTQKRKISGERFLLCGDAASLINPLWGHGIDTAMRSGLLAARQAEACFRTGDFSAIHLQAYDVAVYEKYGKEFARSAAALRWFRRFPGLINPAMRIGGHPALVKWMARFYRF